jgi:SAM-dependent methyltransferase
MGNSWISYDSAAATHNRLGVPSMFSGPARDLAERMEAGPETTWLDVGTGSGIVATMAKTAGVIGLDPSTEMLRLARENGVRRVVAGAVPGLPFPDGSFDCVTAGFVLSHIHSYEAALRDMVRVLRPGGRLGVSAWGIRRNPYGELWDAMTERAVGPVEMSAATQSALPWEEWLGRSENLRSALQDVGLDRITVDLLTYPVHTSIGDYLAIRWNSLSARFVRTRLDAEEWHRFQETVRQEFHRRFRDPIDHERDALLAVGDSTETTRAVVRAEPVLR